MARIAPFQPYRYSASAGKPEDVVTQPYDKISPEMQTRYLGLSPYNLVRIILGPHEENDNEERNVYTRAAGHFRDWIDQGVLARDPEPGFYAYFQEFAVPGTGERLSRKGFIGLGEVVDYDAGVVHRHEQTLAGPKKDRRQVLEATRGHFGHIFMLYPDPAGEIDALLDRAAHHDPAVTVMDEYDTRHTLYKIGDPVTVSRIQELMADRKLLIADGHHRYETALQFRKDHPELEDARWVMMTFVNMYSEGLRILATHRVVSGLDNFDPAGFLAKVKSRYSVSELPSVEALTQAWSRPAPDRIRIGLVAAGHEGAWLLERPRAEGHLDVDALHRELLEEALGIDAEAVREQRFLKYVRGVDAAVDLVTSGKAQAAFLLEATTIQQTADTAFAGKCMPQKSTDFYPKLLSGLTIYRLER